MLVKHPSLTLQDSLLTQYCSEAEERILSAATILEARQIGEELCTRFQRECSSELLFHATRQYIEEIIARTFGP